MDRQRIGARVRSVSYMAEEPAEVQAAVRREGLGASLSDFDEHLPDRAVPHPHLVGPPAVARTPDQPRLLTPSVDHQDAVRRRPSMLDRENSSSNVRL